MIPLSVFPKSAAHHLAKHVRPASCGMLFIARNHITRAHRASIRLAASAHTGTKLDSLSQPALIVKIKARDIWYCGEIIRADSQMVRQFRLSGHLSGIHLVG